MPAEKELRDELQELAKKGQTLLDELGDAAAAKNEAKAERQKRLVARSTIWNLVPSTRRGIRRRCL
jgi:hypothetical protein